MPRHHYVSQFILERWASNGQLSAFSWNPNAQRVINDPVSVKNACQIRNLNAPYGVPRAQSNKVEDIFTQQIDTPAARALAVILSDGVDRLTDEQRISWARFIVAFAVRTPETLRKMGPIETRNGLEVARNRAKGPADSEAIVTKLIEENMSSIERNMPLGIAVELSLDMEKIYAVAAMDWWVRRFEKRKILLGDRPLLAKPRMPYPCGIPLNNQSCLIALPIAPDAIFFASGNNKNRAETRKMSPNRLIRLVNDETISCADKYVYSADSSMAALITKRLVSKIQDEQQGISPRPLNIPRDKRMV